MEIKSFLPFIITNEIDKTKKYFEQMGFSQAHSTLNVSPTHNDTFNLKDEKGNQIQLIDSSSTPTMYGIRINVDDFDDAVKFFENMGFKTITEGLTETSFAKSVMVRSTEGISFLITKHLK